LREWKTYADEICETLISRLGAGKTRISRLNLRFLLTRKLRLRLGGDPADDEYPDKPPRMRWATYNRLVDRLIAADAVTDERLKRARAIVDQERP
jgi:hypothetical protein